MCEQVQCLEDHKNSNKTWLDAPNIMRVVSLYSHGMYLTRIW